VLCNGASRVITWLTLFQYTFATPSTSEQQNRSDHQEDAGANSTETGCAAQQIQYELAQQVTRQKSQDTEDSNQSNAICQEHLISHFDITDMTSSSSKASSKASDVPADIATGPQQAPVQPKLNFPTTLKGE